MWYLTLWALAKTRVGMAVIGAFMILVGVLVWMHKHDANLIAEHDRASAAQVQERENAALGGDRNLPANPDSVQQDDRRCRDCRE